MPSELHEQMVRFIGAETRGFARNVREMFDPGVREHLSILRSVVPDAHTIERIGADRLGTVSGLDYTPGTGCPETLAAGLRCVVAYEVALSSHLTPARLSKYVGIWSELDSESIGFRLIEVFRGGARVEYDLVSGFMGSLSPRGGNWSYPHETPAHGFVVMS